MLKLFVKRCVVLPAFAAVCWGTSGLDAAEVPVPARVLKHTAVNGQSFSAVVLKASELPNGIVARDHVILIDTSASQVGEHRQRGYAVLTSLLQSLPETDRVRLFAVDVQAEALDEGFNSPRSTQVQASLDSLQSRVPLGATNLHAVLDTALQAAADRPTDITYIGDGMSTADLIESTELRGLLARLRQRQVPVNSFGVGPQMNLHLLGILAHQTGGLVTYDTPDDAKKTAAEQAVDAKKTVAARDLDAKKTAAEKSLERGQVLAAALQTPVFFPTQMTVTPESASLLPGTPLPMRTDRETIYLTSRALPANTRIVLADGDDQTVSLEWKLAAPIEQPTIAFLPEFARRLEQDGGLSNSLAGLSLMNLAQEDFAQRVAGLVDQGQLALKRGDIRQAAQLAEQVVQVDPSNSEVKALFKTVDRLKVRTVAQVTTDAAPPAAPTPDLEERVNPDPNASLLDNQQVASKVMTEKLRNQVSSAIESARKSDDPDAGLGQLKRVLDAVKSAIDIAPEDRLRLQKQLEGEILQQKNQKEIGEQRRSQALVRRSQIEATQRLAEQLMLDEEKLENLIDRARSLMLEGRHGRDEAYAEAQDVADIAINLRPGESTSSAARFDAESAQQLLRSFRLRARRADQFLETLHQVELSHVPFPDEPPIRFPPAEVWKSLSERRRKWATVDLKKDSPNEQRIQRALLEPTEVAFNDNPLEEALNYLKDLHGIEIWIDKEALSADGIATDTQVNLNLSGISLRSALRLLLEPLLLTYVIEDEVMKITTKVKADEKMSTRVYPVADLVVPIIQLGGGQQGGLGGGQQGGGQQGGGQQGGGGGFGGGGGGFGGGGGGFGGGGRFFSVPAELIAPQAPGQADKIGRATSKQIPQFDNRSIEALKKKRTP